MDISQEGPITEEEEEEELNELKNLEMSREEFKNYVSVDANDITFEIPTPEDIQLKFKLKQMKKILKVTMITTNMKNFKLNRPQHTQLL